MRPVFIGPLNLIGDDCAIQDDFVDTSVEVSLPTTVFRRIASDLVKQAGTSCSKLTMSLVNDSLKFQIAILQIQCYFLLKKCENPLHCKGFSHFINKK